MKEEEGGKTGAKKRSGQVITKKAFLTQTNAGNKDQQGRILPRKQGQKRVSKQL